MCVFHISWESEFIGADTVSPWSYPGPQQDILVLTHHTISSHIHTSGATSLTLLSWWQWPLLLNQPNFWLCQSQMSLCTLVCDHLLIEQLLRFGGLKVRLPSAIFLDIWNVVQGKLCHTTWHLEKAGAIKTKMTLIRQLTICLWRGSFIWISLITSTVIGLCTSAGDISTSRAKPYSRFGL